MMKKHVFCNKGVLYYNKGDHVYILRYCWNWSFSSRTLSSNAATRLANAKNVLCCSRIIRAISISSTIISFLQHKAISFCLLPCGVRLSCLDHDSVARSISYSKRVSLTLIRSLFSFPTLPKQYFCKCPVAVVMNKPSSQSSYATKKITRQSPPTNIWITKSYYLLIIRSITKQPTTRATRMLDGFNDIACIGSVTKLSACLVK